MTTCPACSQSVTPNDLTCPRCAITLYHEQAGGGQAPSEGGGPSLLVIVGAGLIGVIAAVLCAGGFATSIFSRTRAVPLWAGSSMVIPAPGMTLEAIEVETGAVPENPDEAPADKRQP